MRLSILGSIFIITSCTSPAGTIGAPGPKGDEGPPGPRGEPGASGSPGVCDATTCSPVTSLDGLSGGVVSGTSTFDNVVTQNGIRQESGSSPGPHGIVIERGGRETSAGGFYCGRTSFNVNGNLYNASHTYSMTDPYRIAKRHCEDACPGKAAAHPCLTTEVLSWQYLGGGHSSDSVPARNAAVPMPPDESEGWVMSADVVSSCESLTGDNTKTGIVYFLAGDSGGLVRRACDETHPLLCCY